METDSRKERVTSLQKYVVRTRDISVSIVTAIRYE
jgi:hypothetical protein